MVQDGDNMGKKIPKGVEHAPKKNTHLIERADRSNENDRVGIIEIRNPGMALSACAADIEQVPGYGLSMDINVKYVFSHPHSLYTRMQNVVFQSKGEYMREKLRDI